MILFNRGRLLSRRESSIQPRQVGSTQLLMNGTNISLRKQWTHKMIHPQ